MPPSNRTVSGAPCPGCDYRNPPEARTCGLCGEFLVGAALTTAPRAASGAALPPAAPVPADGADEAPTARAVAPSPHPPDEERGNEPYVPDPEIDGAGLREVRVRVRERCLQHGWAGAGIVLGLTTLFGLPRSLLPLTLLLNAFYALLFGFPLGFLASYGRVGRFRGALLGAAMGGAFGLVAVAVHALGPRAIDLRTAILEVGVSAILGIFCGGLVGFHVESDD
jgi:hypothetical protein